MPGATVLVDRQTPVSKQPLQGRHYSEPAYYRHRETLPPCKQQDLSWLPDKLEKAEGASDLDNSPVNVNQLLVEELDHDVSDLLSLPTWRRSSIRFLVVTSATPTIISLCIARIHFGNLVYFWTERVFPRSWMLLAFVLVTTQNLVLLPTFITSFLQAKAAFAKLRPRLRLVGDAVPVIDVIITTCREPSSIVKNTIRAALALDYPAHRYRVIVSDDGASPELRAWVATMALERPNLHYTARKKDGPEGYKAGNLNHAVKYAEELPRGDADMIPERHWLRAVAAHMAQDSRLGVVCPPQQYYNAPLNDPLIQTLQNDWRIAHVLQDMCGWAWNCGSGWLVRRAALRSIGGFPTDCLIEDVCSSILMLAQDWKSAYLPEALQYGLVPEDYAAHVKQRTWWNIGGGEMALLMGFYLNRRKSGRLTFAQRALGMANGLGSLVAPVSGVVNVVATALAFVTAVHFVYFHDMEQFRLLLRLQCAMIVANWLRQCHAGLLTGYKGAMQDVGGISYMAPYFVLTTIRSIFLPARWGGKRAAFTPTGSLEATINECSPLHRAPLHRRLRHIILDCGAWFHVLVVLILPLSAAVDVLRISRAYDGEEFWIELLKRVAWPAPHWVVTVMVFMIPLQYAVRPPSVADLDELLERADERGARYPLKEARTTRFEMLGMRSTAGYHFVLLYAAIVFVASFWI